MLCGEEVIGGNYEAAHSMRGVDADQYCCRFRKHRPAEWRLLTNHNIIAVDDRNCPPVDAHAVRLLQVAIAA